MPKIKKEDYFKIQPYKSILFMLMNYLKKGLKPMHIRYELGMETKDRDGNVFRAKLKILDSEGNPTTNAKDIEKTLAEKRYLFQNRIKKDCIRYSKHLREKLSILETAGIIFKEKGYYKIHTDFFNIGWKIAGIETFCSYPDDQTLVKVHFRDQKEVIQNTPGGTKVIIQGLNLESLDIKGDDEKFKEIMENVKKINDAVENLDEIKRKRINDMWSFKVKKFCDKTKSKQIKKAMEESNENFLFTIDAIITANRLDNVIEKEIMKVFEWEKKKIYELDNKKISKAELKRDLKDWSKDIFLKEYNFSLDELKEIEDWQYEVAEWYIHQVPSSIIALCFIDWLDNPIIDVQKDTKQVKEK